MGQYDYRGTAQTRMYDWLVTRSGDSLSLCNDAAISEIEQEDLAYVRSLVAADADGHVTPDLPGIITDRAAQVAVDNAERPKEDPDKPAPATGGVDYYDMVDPQTGKKKGLPQALGPAPPPTRRYLDEDNQWQEGDRPLYVPDPERPDLASPEDIRKALGLDEEEDA